jgi:hypothetical protein
MLAGEAPSMLQPAGEAAGTAELPDITVMNDPAFEGTMDDKKQAVESALRAAFSRCRVVLGLTGQGRIERSILVLIAHACGGKALAEAADRNFEQRTNVWTGEAKVDFRMEEFINMVQQEIVPSMRVRRARSGLVTVAGAAEIYRRVQEQKLLNSSSSDFEVFQMVLHAIDTRDTTNPAARRKCESR